MLQFVYDLNSGSDRQIVDAPKWVGAARFDIDARPDAETIAELDKLPTVQRTQQMKAMVRGLLADRFHLRVHQDTREFAVNALVVARSGAKLTPAPDPGGDRSPPGPNDWEGLRNPSRGHTVGHTTTIQTLVNLLNTEPELAGRLIVDDTGLKGEYNFDLKWTPERAMDASPAGGAELTWPSLFTALQEQLGLKIESTKAPVDCIVIDHVEQPSPN